jgi:hypothetical protein
MNPSRRRGSKKRVRFTGRKDLSTPTPSPTALDPAKALLDPHPTDETLKPKDTKAVKRSPYLSSDNFGSFNFPDFDEFGGKID